MLTAAQFSGYGGTMASNQFRLTLGEALDEIRLPERAERGLAASRPVKPTIDAHVVVRAVKATAGAEDVIAKVPGLVTPRTWLPVATFSVCLKTGTATWLDIWDCDHFDGFTDIPTSLADCRV